MGVAQPKRIEPSTKMGITSAKRPSRNVRSRSCQPLRGSVESICPRDTHHHATTSDSPISTPGTMPATNSRGIDTLAATPKTTKPIDGGITGAITPPAAISPAERGMS